MNKKFYIYQIKRFVKASLVVLLSTFIFLSCKKEVTDPKKGIFVKPQNLDSIFGAWGVEDIIALPDNSYWLRFSINSFTPFKERFEHYDEKLNLINVKVIENYRFKDFVVNGNNDIVTSALYYNPKDNKGTYRFLKLDNNFNFLEVNSEPEISNYLKPLNDVSYESFLTKLSNGNYIFGFFTMNGYGTLDSANSILASYNDPVKSGVPNWVNKNIYHDNSLGIKNSRIIEIASDTKNNFYILCGTNDRSFILRKHNEQGELIWQKKIPNAFPFGDINFRLNVEEGRIFICSPANKIYIFDDNGGFSEKQLPIPEDLGSRYCIPTLNLDGYISVYQEVNKLGNYATLLKYDNNFNLIKSKRFGNQGTRYSKAIARLPNGKIILSGFVENPIRKGWDLMQLKVNDDLEVVD